MPHLGTMDTTTHKTRTTFVILIAVVAVNVLLVITFNIYPEFFPRQLLAQVFLGRPNSTSHNGGIVPPRRPDYTYVPGNDVVDAAVDKQYKNIMKKYYEKIASIPRHKYKPSDSFTDIGPPISSLLNVSPQLSSSTKLLLLWTPFFGAKTWLDDTVFKQCPETPCHITNDKSKLLESHGVIMHARDMSGKQSLPPKRQPWQRWIYFLLESAVHNYLRLTDFKNVFNWTATYRLDTDTHIGYGGFYKREPPMKPYDFDVLVSNILNTKRKLVAARISNCDRSKTGRLSYITELQKYIPVDVYGHCGTMENPKGQKGNEILKEYKFYLAFENSFCRDYITEKFWHPFVEWSSVPVVMGASPEDYQVLASDDFYINTAGFESAKHLAEYLQLLDGNDHLYKRYLTWNADLVAFREYFNSLSTLSKQWCELCSALHNMSLPFKSYRDFNGWYREDYCRR